MEFVGYGTGEDDSTQVDESNSGLGEMSERVQAMAQTIYEELEILVGRYGTESAQSITPILVRLLEGLDEEIKFRRKIQTDLELAKADREQLLNHFERERELRRKAEERHLNVEGTGSCGPYQGSPDYRVLLEIISRSNPGGVRCYPK